MFRLYRFYLQLSPPWPRSVFGTCEVTWLGAWEKPISYNQLGMLQICWHCPIWWFYDFPHYGPAFTAVLRNTTLSCTSTGFSQDACKGNVSPSTLDWITSHDTQQNWLKLWHHQLRTKPWLGNKTFPHMYFCLDQSKLALLLSISQRNRTRSMDLTERSLLLVLDWRLVHVRTSGAMSAV